MKIYTPGAVILAAAFASLVSLTSARGDVDFTSNQTSFTVAPGGSFTLTLDLDITGGEQVTGLSYNWKVNAPGSGLFSIANRDIGASVFSALTQQNSTVESGPGNILSPANQFDLGAGVPDGNSVTNNTYLVANFTFDVSDSAAAGTYILSPTFGSLTNGDWTDPDFNDNDISSPLNITVHISTVPEPSTWALLLAGVGLIAMWRMRRQKVV